MAILNNTPSNINFMSPLKFTFTVHKLPNVNFFVQGVTLPSITVTPRFEPTPFVKLPFPGDHIEFTELLITYRVDEDMKNYLEVFNWMTALGFPKDFNQYKALADRDRRTNVSGTDSIMSDATLIIHNSNANPNMKVNFINLFPTTLSELMFDTRQQDIEYVENTVSFAFERFEVETI